MKILAKVLKLVIMPASLAIKGAILSGVTVTPNIFLIKITGAVLKKLAANSKNKVDDKFIAEFESLVNFKK